MKTNKDYDEKFYKINQKDIVSAQKILPYIVNGLKPKSVVDFGCGSATWLSTIQDLGVQDILGIDGEYVDTSWMLIDKKYFLAANLSEQIKLDKKYDMALCLEVAEHINEENNEALFKNLTNSSDIILFSAAIPFQGGTNHENEQYPKYWIEKFKKYGFEPYDALRWKFWDDNNIAFWYRQNIMFIVKTDKLKELKKVFPVNNIPINIVHPEKLKRMHLDFTNELKRLEQEITNNHQEIERLNEIINKQNEVKQITNPKVSIVVPVFNVKDYLRECLDSILNQTLKEIEVLCGDGGSTDGSLEILLEYQKKDNRVKVISREKSGYGQSVNECMDLAQGEYIGIVESDDKVKPNMYETLYNLAKKHDLDWIRSDIFLYYSELPEDKQLVKESITYGKNIYNQVLNPQIDISPYKTGLRSWSGIYKKDFLNFYHIRHHETPGGSYQDVGFYLRTLYDAKRVYFLDKAFYMWRQDNPGSSIHYNSKKLVEKSVYEWKLNKEYLSLRNDATKRIWGSYNYRRYYSYLWTIDMASKEDKKEMIKYAKKEFKEALNNNQIDRAFFDDGEWYQFKKFVGE